MVYYKTNKDGVITDVVSTTDVEWAERNGYINDRAVVQVYDGSFKFADKTTEDDFKPPLNELKASKIAELKAIRDAKEVDDIQVNGYLYDYDEKARERINAAIIALDLTGGTITWTLADNTDTEVSANDLRYVIAMVAQRSNELHVKYRNLKERVESATTKEQVEAIVWDE